MFESARLKIDRAKFHIDDLKRQIDAFIALKPHIFRVKNDTKIGKAMIQIKLDKPIPKTFSVIVGDAIHNMRSALDHLIWEIIRRESGNQHSSLYFPCHKNRTDYESCTKGMIKECRVRPWVTDFFVGLEVFPGGRNAPLRDLHELDITDKHCAIVPTVRATGHPPFTTYNSDGSVAVHMHGNLFVAPEPMNIVKIITIPSDGWLQLDGDADCPVSIFLGEITNGDVDFVLRTFLDCTGGILREAESAITNNPKPS